MEAQALPLTVCNIFEWPEVSSACYFFFIPPALVYVAETFKVKGAGGEGVWNREWTMAHNRRQTEAETKE